jgi:hypothetical protein
MLFAVISTDSKKHSEVTQESCKSNALAYPVRLLFGERPQSKGASPSWLEALLDAAFPANSPAFRGTPEKLRGENPPLDKKPCWTLRFCANSPAPVSVVPPETTQLFSLLDAAQK